MGSTPRLTGYPVDQELVGLEAQATATRRARRERRAQQRTGWRRWLLAPWRSDAHAAS